MHLIEDGSVVDSQILFEEGQSRRPLLRCAQLLFLVQSPSRRAGEAAKIDMCGFTTTSLLSRKVHNFVYALKIPSNM